MGVLQMLLDGLISLFSSFLSWVGSLGFDPFPGLVSNVSGFISGSVIGVTIIHDFIPVVEMLAIFSAWLTLFPLMVGVNVLFNWLKAKF